MLNISKPAGLAQELAPRASWIVSAKRKDFEAHQSSIHRRVQDALRKHAQDKGEEFELLAICGVNTEIPKDGNFGYDENYEGYPYSHINIWARLKGSQLADAALKLLFIQCTNDSKDMNGHSIPVLARVGVIKRCRYALISRYPH